MVDIQPTDQQSMTDDQELAKVLAGVNGQVSDAASAYGSTVSTPTPEPTADPNLIEEGLVAPKTAAEITPEDVPVPTNFAPTGDLEGIKNDALVELRPLVDKLQLQPEEKFDTYLLLLRSTDDKALVAPAHEAAKSIVDETRRAQALLDIIKEIDFLSGQQVAA